MVNSIVPVSLNEIESSDIQYILGHLACINTDKGELQLYNKLGFLFMGLRKLTRYIKQGISYEEKSGWE